MSIERISSRYLIRTVITTIIAIAIMWYLMRDYKLNQLRRTFSELDLWMVACGLMLRFFVAFIQGFRWKLLFPRYPFWHSVNAGLLSVAGNTLIPARGGELLRAFYLKYKTKIFITDTIASTIIERLVDATSIFSFLFLSLIILKASLMGSQTETVVWTGLSGVVLINFAFLAYIRFSRFVDPLLRTLSQRLRLPKRIIDQGKSFMAVYKNVSFKQLILAYILAIVLTLLSAFMLWCYIRSCNVPIHLWQSIIIFPLVTLSVAVPVSVGHVGVYHAALIYSLSLLGFVPDQIIGQVIITHLLVILPAILYSIVLISIEKISMPSI